MQNGSVNQRLGSARLRSAPRLGLTCWPLMHGFYQGSRIGRRLKRVRFRAKQQPAGSGPCANASLRADSGRYGGRLHQAGMSAALPQRARTAAKDMPARAPTKTACGSEHGVCDQRACSYSCRQAPHRSTWQTTGSNWSDGSIFVRGSLGKRRFALDRADVVPGRVCATLVDQVHLYGVLRRRYAHAAPSPTAGPFNRSRMPESGMAIQPGRLLTSYMISYSAFSSRNARNMGCCVAGAAVPALLTER